MPKAEYKSPTRLEAKERTRARLLDAADETFRRDGYHGTDLREVARRAGVTTGAVYWSFPSKADLFLAVFDRNLEQRLQEVVALMEEPSPSKRSARAVSEWFRR